MIDTNLLKDLWPEAYKATVYMLNQTPTYILNQETGESKWIILLQHLLFLTKGYIMCPNLTNLHVYGCCAYVKHTEQDISSC